MAQLSEKIFFCSPEFHEVQPQHEYNDLQRCIDAIPAWDKVTIKLLGDFADQGTLQLTEDNIQLTIDGGNQFAIDFKTGGPIVQMDASKTLKFVDMKRIRGDAITIRGDSNFYLNNVLNCVTTIDIVEGKYANVYIINNTHMWGFERNPAIGIYNADSKLHIRNSFIMGGERCPALYFNTDSDGKVKIKNSVILHCEGAENYPVERNNDVFVGIHAYNCAGNEMLCSNRIVNYINTGIGNVVNQEINF